MIVPGSPLTAADLSALAKCGISSDVVELAWLRRVTSPEGGAIVGRNGSGDYGGILFPYIWPGEDHVREYRLRRDHPDVEYDRDGNPKPRAKYLSPPGRGNMLYFPPGTCPEWLQDVSLPLALTEGEKKALALWGLAWHGLGDAAEKPRFLPVAIAGVWNWRGVTGKTTSADGTRVNTKGVISDFSRIQWRGRKVTIAFDANTRSNPQVQVARWELTKELRRRGAQVYWFEWPADTPPEVNGIDDLAAIWGVERVSEALAVYTKPAPTNLTDLRSCEREFQTFGIDGYKLTLPALGIVFQIDRLRRERNELVGELAVRCDLPPARGGYDGVLSIADFNVSSARARTERAKLLLERASIDSLDWAGLLEEFCQRLLAAERQGKAAVNLRDLPRPNRDNAEVRCDGLVLPKNHPAILFGDGGAAKSYTALYVAGQLAKEGIRVALFDWELAGEDHRERLERLFGTDMPSVLYARCERPLTFEAERLGRLVHENSIDYAVFDSVAFACDGPPEAAEVAGRYFRAVRQIGCGSLHIAHVSKSDDSDRKPFGSTFWHNGARMTWFVKASEEPPDEGVLNIGLYNRKANLGPLRATVAFRIDFSDERTTFRRIEAGSNAMLAKKLTIYEQMAYLLKQGSMTAEAIAEEIDAAVESVKRTARRYKDRFVVVEGGKLALLEKRLAR